MRRIIRWVTLALAIAGTLRYVWEGLTSDEYLPWLNGWMAAPIIAVSVVPIVWSMTSGPSRSEFRGGALGIGMLVEARRTGLTINDQPQLDIVFDVDTVDGTRFRGTARQIVDLTELAMLTPGTMLPIRYLPDRADGHVGIASDADPDEVQALMYQVQLAQGKITPQQLRVAQHGVVAQAVVMQMRPTGELRQGDAVIDLLLKVTRPDGTSFDAEVQKPVPAAAIAMIQPGSVVRARYLPGNDADVSLEVRAA